MTEFKPLQRVWLPWQLLVSVLGTIAWASFVPWRVAKALSPEFLRNWMVQLQSFISGIFSPVIDYTKDTSRALVGQFDDLVDYAIHSVFNTIRWTVDRIVGVARSIYNFAERRVESVEKYGWRGLFDDKPAAIRPILPDPSAHTSVVDKAEAILGTAHHKLMAHTGHNVGALGHTTGTHIGSGVKI